MSHASSATIPQGRSSPSSDLTLHIYPPAFGLPSSDPACLAAVAYISNSVPRGNWALVAGTPDEMGASELPALITQHETLEGLDNILTHLRTHHTDLDSRLPSPIACADAIAFTSHLLTTFTPLLALSLYVSSPNYTTTTRHAISSPLPFPLAYTVPPSLRANAKLRSQHLGLSSLDLDAISSSSSADDAPTNPARGIIPQHLLQGMRKGVTETIQEERARLRFRLDGLVDAACDPLARLLGGKMYFLSEDDEEGWSSLDAVALGYLALALIPELPQPWLREGMRGRYPTLSAFVERGVRDVFGGNVTLEMARGGGGILPWRASTPQPLATRVMTAVMGQIVEATPFAASKIKTKRKEEGTVEGEAHSLATTLMLPVAVGAAAVAAVVGGVRVYAGSGAGNSGRSLREMGEAGAIFGGMDLGGGGGGGGRMKGSGQQGNTSGKVEVDAVGVEM